ncbi:MULTISPECIES: SDR family NAD(P)-dependent oxidoreductase [Marivita]|uniref:SDR family oxidoreductase n=1 Tax=Marivita cryptomonadis TaxID=505252 RepID=A0A9Q2P9B0_9RHOB|nr:MULTISPECIES: SDR family oxidoreductase [Marivita]MCR9170162.1 SDR family oxidoreductase [Paracoccaceae bacterium]MBM2320669.1 SDR family oxidoreductase [Marivita cryptomonadis]MBM2330249.1 SDR family oxidoreductase [Marivita cryptomonadis]MBM2339836.1 SDR family oxidoreductase [Marivita cryptomonadis]MBM2344495.1 SDR family oxidoreductase [Marivita cryptomonadis]
MTSYATFHDLKDASVFITGGGSGIGAALTDGFLEQGAKVAFVGRSDASDFVAEMEAKHGTAPLFIQCDITDTAALQAAITQSAEAHGPITVLVNNAANDKRHAALDVDAEFWDWSLSINLDAYFFACQAVIPGMQAASGGAIINFSSISYMMGNAGYIAYTTANAGITGMTRSLAREFGPDNIRANALAPGWVLTPKQKELWADPASLATHLDKQCLKEHLVEQDVVDATLFLASKTSRMMTGQTLAVDGGVVTVAA